MKSVIFLIGNIGAGKTTFTQYLKNDCVIINPDAIRYSLGAGSYRFDSQSDHVVIEAAQILYEGFLRHDVNIVYDSSAMVNIHCRERLLNELKRYNEVFFRSQKRAVAVVFPKLPMKKSVDRRMRDPHGNYDRKLWNEVWKKFNSSYEYPHTDEGFEHVFNIAKMKNNHIFKELRKLL